MLVHVPFSSVRCRSGPLWHSSWVQKCVAFMTFILKPLWGGVHGNVPCQHWTLTVFTIQVSFMKLGNRPCIGDLSWMAASKVPTQEQANIKCCFEVPPYICMAHSTAALCFYFNCNKDSWELFEPLCLRSAKGSKHHLWLWPDSSICLVQSHSSHSSTTPAVMIRKSSPANNRFRSAFLPKRLTATDVPWFELRILLRCIYYGIRFLRQHHPASARKPRNQSHLSILVEKVRNICPPQSLSLGPEQL